MPKVKQTYKGYGMTSDGVHEVIEYEYKGYKIRKEYGGYGVNGSMFDSKKAAKEFIDFSIAKNRLEA